MNYLKENAFGIDETIKYLQKYLYDNLVRLWGLSKLDGYGRVYKNNRDNKVFPEYYSGSKDYKEVLLDDRRDGIFFFSPDDITDVYDNTLESDCDIIFTLNLNNISSNFERQDEEARQQVLYLLNNYVRRQKVKKIITGLNNVYQDYNGVAEYFKDMQEFHHFKVTLELRYINNKCN